MSKNIDQVYIDNPITTNASTDLMYFGQSPYGPTDDAAMLFSDFSAQFALASSIPWSVANGGTGDISFTAYAVICGGTSSTGALQSIAGVGSSLQVLTSNGPGALPTMQNTPWVVGAGSTSAKGGSATTAAGTRSLAWGASVSATNAGSFVIGDNFGQSATDGSINEYVATFKNGHFWYTTPAGSALLSTSVNALGQHVTAQGVCDTSYSYQTPSTGFSITASRSSETLELKPAGTLATGTIIFPPNPNDGQKFRVSTTQTITALTLSGNSHTIQNAVTTLLAGQGFCYQYNSGQTTWIPVYQTYIPAAGATATQVQAWDFNSVQDSGVATNVYIGAYTPAITNYATVTGAILTLTNINATNTGASTIDAGGGADPIITPQGNPLVGGEMPIGGDAVFLVTASGFVLLNSALAAGGSSPWSAGAGTDSAYGGGAIAAAGNNSLVWGSNSIATGIGAVAIGLAGGAQATGNSAFAIGGGSNALGTACMAFGYGATAQHTFSLALGNNTNANADYATCIGRGATVTHQGSCSFSDSTNDYAADSTTDQFNIRFGNGYRFFTSSSALIWALDPSGNVINYKGEADQSYSLQIPTTGFSITIAAGVQRLILNPAGALLTGTITMPAAPIQGQIIKISCTQIVTALTISANAGQSIINPLGAFAAGQAVSYLYDLASTTWLPTA